jgi:hypothetical protein
MIAICGILAAGLAAVVLFELYCLTKAPLGYQDETGFHFSPEVPRPAVFQPVPLASPVATQRA